MADDFGFTYYTPKATLIFRVRQVISHLEEAFSKFSKYIAPAVHHDRCERSVQMKLYNMHKREFVMIFIIFFASLSLSIFIGLAGPPITLTVEQRASQIVPNKDAADFATGPFIIKSPPLSTYSQQLWVIGQFVMKPNEEQIFKKEFLLEVSLQGLGQTTSGTSDKNIHLQNRTLSCNENTCSDFSVLHLGFIEHTHYIFNITFKGLESVHKWSPIRDVIFYLKTYNPSFTKLEVWLRFAFVGAIFFLASWFVHSLRKFSVHDWSLEQRWMSVLLPLAFLYNDPIFPLIFLVDSWVPPFLDTLFQSTFLFALLLFWLCTYHGLRQNQRSFSQFYLPKLAIVGWMWFCLVVVSTAQKVSELRDPLYSAALRTNNFYVFKILFFAAMSIYILYLLYLMVSAFSELRSMPFFDVRLKFLTLLMTITASFLVVMTTLRFGVGALEDNFVAQLSTTYSSSAEFTAFYGILNFYVFICTFVYSPSERSIVDSLLLKDNPGLSMMNDSDEDVVYGSEDEDDDTRRPLNRGSNENDESD